MPSIATLTQLQSPILVLGPAHSGKSELASQLLKPDTLAVVLGTAPTDERAFARRLAFLRNLRPPAWESFDAGSDLPAALADAAGKSGQVLVDSVSQWLAGLVVGGDGVPEHELESTIDLAISELARVVTAHPEARIVLVSAEVGAGPAPSRPAERAYRLAVGNANRRLAAAASTVLLVNAGIPQRIKG